MNETPIEKYRVGNKYVWVKREDLAADLPAPSFSKIRGLIPHLEKLRSSGIKCVGYTETTVSMAGWGVAWAAQIIGLKSVIFEPVYVSDRPDLRVLEKHKEYWKQFGADIIGLPAGRAKVNFYLSRKILAERYENAQMLPLGLPFQETIEETAKIARQVEEENNFQAVVVNIGSGTICAGLLRGFNNVDLYGVMGRTGSVEGKTRLIYEKADVPQYGLFRKHLTVVDPGWEYTEPAEGEAPFPCHKYYDLKAFRWLEENIQYFFHNKKVLFWNIGS